jgi:general secretion pathway protein A
VYESHWQLTCKPFDAGSGAAFYYPAEAHQAALLKLRYAVEGYAPAALLVGAGGTGKTMLVQMLLRDLPEAFAPRVHVVFPQMPAGELLGWLADELGAAPAEPADRSVSASVRRIETALAVNAEAGRHAVVVVDEAHLLDDARSLDALRLILNFQTGGRPRLSLVLVGQPSLWPAVERNRQLEERLAMKCLLHPFSADETAAYVQHRLAAAGSPQPIFDSPALDALHEQCGGIPRRLNRLCEFALLVGYADEHRALTREHVESVGEELATVG